MDQFVDTERYASFIQWERPKAERKLAPDAVLRRRLAFVPHDIFYRYYMFFIDMDRALQNPPDASVFIGLMKRIKPEWSSIQEIRYLYVVYAFRFNKKDAPYLFEVSLKKLDSIIENAGPVMTGKALALKNKMLLQK